jgi:hypothetical protein
MKTLKFSAKFSAAALAAGLLVWAGGAVAGQPVVERAADIESSDLLGAAVASDVLKRERGMSGLAIASQEAEQNVINVINAEGNLTLEAGQIVLGADAVVGSSFNVFSFNTGMNATTNIQFLMNVYIE